MHQTLQKKNRKSFFCKLNKWILIFSKHYDVILGGDFNYAENNNLDRYEQTDNAYSDVS